MSYFDAINWAVETLSAKRIVPLPTGSSSTPTLELAGTVNLTGTTTISGALTTTSTLSPTSTKEPAVNLAHAGGALTAAQSGQTFVGVVDAAYTLPLASVGNGVHFKIMCGALSVGTGLTITRAGSDTIESRVSATGAVLAGKTTITNSGATDVVGDMQWLISDGVSAWRCIGVIGTWA
jgi:hypothetical protein